MIISHDRTYKTVDYKIEVKSDDNPFEEKERLKYYVEKLIEKYEFLNEMQCLKYIASEESNGDTTVVFTFWIDEIEVLREEQPHLFV